MKNKFFIFLMWIILFAVLVIATAPTSIINNPPSIIDYQISGQNINFNFTINSDGSLISFCQVQFGNANYSISGCDDKISNFTFYAHTKDLSTNDSGNSGAYGVIIKPFVNIWISGFNKTGNDLSTIGHLRNITGQNITTCTFVGNYCQFSTPYFLANNTQFIISANSTGAVDRFRMSSAGLPQNSIYFVFNMTYIAGQILNTDLYTIQALNVSNVAPNVTPPPATNRNLSIALNATVYENRTAISFVRNNNSETNINITHWEYRIFENSKTFESTVSAGDIRSFMINITYNSSLYTSISTSFIYNKTLFSPTKIGSGDNIVFNSSITIPFVSSSSTNKNFYWNFTLTNSTGSIFYLNSSTSNQTINTLGIDNCTVNNNTILNFTLFDEDDRTNLNGTIEVITNIFTAETSNLIVSFNNSFSYNYNSYNAKVCLSTLNQTYTMSYQTKYYSNTSNYQVEYKNAQGITLSNSTAPQNVKLFDLLSSRNTAFTIVLQGSDLSTIANAIIDVQRQYVPINQFLSVEAPLTDNTGTTIVHLVAKEPNYNFIVSKNGIILGTFTNYIVKCQSEINGDCRIILNLIKTTATIEDYNTYGNLYVFFNLDKTTRILSVDYTSADNAVHTVKLNVIKHDAYGNNTICSTIQLGSSGTLSCNIPISFGNSTLIGELYSDGIFVGRTITSLEQAAIDIYGKGTGLLLGMLMYSTLILLFVGTPIMIVVGAILGMGLAGAFHFIDGGSFLGNTSIFIFFLLTGIIIIVGIARKT